MDEISVKKVVIFMAQHTPTPNILHVLMQSKDKTHVLTKQ